MWMTGMAAANNPMNSMMTCPDRRSESTSVPYRKTARMSSVGALGLRYPTNDVVRNVKRQEEEREQRRDRQHGVVFHWKLSLRFCACLIALPPLPRPSSAARSHQTPRGAVHLNPAATAKLTISQQFGNTSGSYKVGQSIPPALPARRTGGTKVIWRPDRIKKKREIPSRCSIYFGRARSGLRDAAH